jgi:hypothetical protein
MNAQQPRAAALLGRTTLLLLLLVSSAAAEPVWVLQSARTNPKDEPKRFDAGITPGYYSPRFAGSFEEVVVSEEKLGVKLKWIERERLDYDVELTANMKPPENTLKPGDTIPLEVQFAKSGSVQSGNPGIIFRFAVSDGNLSGPPEVGFFPFAPDYAGPATAVWKLTVPAARDGEFTIDASLDNHGAAWVRWMYRIEEKSASPAPISDWEELLPDYFRPKRSTSTSSRGVVIEPRGTIEIYDAAFDRWRGPLRSDTEIREGDQVRTGPKSTCRVVFANRAGLQDTVTIGEETLLEIPRRDRPPLSLAAELILGVIRIKHALVGDPSGPPESPFVVRTATIIAGSRGTDYVMSVTRDNTVRVFVEEGVVGVFAIGPQKLTELGPGEKVTISPTGEARIDRMGPGEYAGLMGDRTPTDDVGIPVPNAKITGLRFFEGSKNVPPFGQRKYAKTFPKSTARYIYWELTYTCSAPGRRVDFTILANYVQLNGDFSARRPFDTFVEADWTRPYCDGGYGMEEPGSWSPGTYIVDLIVDGKPITTGSFEITPD